MSAEWCWHLAGIQATSNILGLPVDMFARSLGSQYEALRPRVRAYQTPQIECGLRDSWTELDLFQVWRRGTQCP